jgi:hypothetical protein
MNPDAMLLALLAVADLAILAHLRHRNAQRLVQERLMASLQFAVHRANSVEEMPERVLLQQAS